MSAAETEMREEIERLKAGMIAQSYFVMFRNNVNPSKIEAVMLDHYRWIIGLEKQGVVFASGPLFKEDDKIGIGMTIFRVPDRETAAALAAQDPFVKAGAAEYDIQRWQINEGRVTVSIDFSDQTCKFI